MRLEGWHFVIVIALALLLFGAPRLPGLARSAGQSLRIFRSEVRQMKDESPAASTEPAGSTEPAVPAPVAASPVPAPAPATSAPLAAAAPVTTSAPLAPAAYAAPDPAQKGQISGT